MAKSPKLRKEYGIFLRDIRIIVWYKDIIIDSKKIDLKWFGSLLKKGRILFFKKSLSNANDSILSILSIIYSIKLSFWDMS